MHSQTHNCINTYRQRLLSAGTHRRRLEKKPTITHTHSHMFRCVGIYKQGLYSADVRSKRKKRQLCQSFLFIVTAITLTVLTVYRITPSMASPSFVSFFFPSILLTLKIYVELCSEYVRKKTAYVQTIKHRSSINWQVSSWHLPSHVQRKNAIKWFLTEDQAAIMTLKSKGAGEQQKWKKKRKTERVCRVPSVISSFHLPREWRQRLMEKAVIVGFLFVLDH